jgi:deoxyribonuclease V
MSWPGSAAELTALQESLGRRQPVPWHIQSTPAIAGCFVCWRRGIEGWGIAGEPGWAAAALLSDGRLIDGAVVTGVAGAAYEPGLLALREGPLLAAAVRALPHRPDVLLVNATGRDHPRRAGLALHLGAVLDLPTVGVTHRPLLAAGVWPPDEAGAVSPLRLDGEIVGVWLRTRRGARPLAVHAAWRTDAATAIAVVRAAAGGARTPEPLRQARELARTARAAHSPESS